MVTLHETVAIIPARWESTRLPGKVLADLDGRPMLQWVWELCRRAGLSRVVIATDSERVAVSARAFGAEVVMTGPCDSGTDRVARVAARLGATWVLGVQADEPLLDPEVLRALVRTLHGTTAELVTPMCPVTPEEVDDPHVVKCEAAPDGRALWFDRYRSGTHRHLGIYGWRSVSLARFSDLPQHPEELRLRLEQLRALHAGMDVRLVEVAPQPPGVDTPHDLARVREQLRSCTTPLPG